MTAAARPEPDPPPPPPGMFWYKGRLRVRRLGFLRLLRTLRCPEGHAFQVHGFVTGDYGAQCTHRARPGAAMCGALLLLVLVPRPGGRRQFWGADVTRAELDAMADLGLDGDGMIHHLGGSFPE